MWASIKNVQDSLGVQNIFDQVLREIYAVFIKQKTL